LFRSDDIEFVRDRLSSVYGVDRFDSSDVKFGVRANYAQFSSIGLAYCAYAGEASLSFPESRIVRQFFSIEGAATFKATGASRIIGAWSPIISGNSRLDLDFTAGYRQLVVRIDAGALERLLKSIVGDDGDTELSFIDDDPDPMPMTIVRRDVFRFAEELDRYGQDYSRLVVAELERSLLVRLLLAHRHNFSHRLYDVQPRANRAVVDVVESYLEAHWDQPIDFEKIAKIANVSVRTVFREFSEKGRPPPGVFLRQIRLQHAASQLRHADQQTSVVSVALKCGFRNVGRFASEYRRLIGELPSETLANARRRR
jgi:AraC-like DNA-binding protein